MSRKKKSRGSLSFLKLLQFAVSWDSPRPICEHPQCYPATMHLNHRVCSPLEKHFAAQKTFGTTWSSSSNTNYFKPRFLINVCNGAYSKLYVTQ